MRVRTGGPLVLAVGLLLAGCATTVTGTARAADAAAPPTSSDPGQGPRPGYLSGFGPAPATRPAELPLDGVDLCGLVPAAVAEQVGAAGPGRLIESACTFPLAKGASLDVRVGTTPASGFVGNGKVAGYPVDVGGYLVVVGWNLPDDGSSCFVNLDTTSTDNLEVVVSAAARPGTDALCPTALTVVAAALEQLQAG